jgi:lipopolysaccharide export LptBFGC system permease protein LptF
MRPSSVLATFVTSAAVVFASLVAPAGIAHADQTAQDTIAQLQSEGYTVNVDRVGSGRIENCLVTSVRNPQQQTRNLRDYYGPRDQNGDRKYRIIEVVVSQSISVSLDCST